MKNVKIALIGCGYWGKNLARIYSQLGALGAIVDTNTKRAKSYSKKYGVPCIDMDTMLSDPSIDGVVIASPAKCHKDQSLQAIKAGKHVYVEKPLALSLSDGKIVCNAARVTNLTLMTGHLLQYHPTFITLRDMVERGELGALRYAYSTRV
ncbi:MAG: Gfo/Idh/MocA family oxidoreductase [Robiginitomaculum sp.]